MIATIARVTLLCMMSGILVGTSAAQAEERLLLVHRDELLNHPPTQTLKGQEVRDIHRTSMSRTSLVRLSETSPVMAHPEGERTLIILEGEVTFTFAGEQKTLGAGDYVAIPAGEAYRMAPANNGQSLLLSFEVPPIDLVAAQPADLQQLQKSQAPVIKVQESVMAGPTSWDDPSDRGWTLAKTAEKRVNLVEMRSELKNHSHPDADHSLILLEGRARVVTPNESRVLAPGDYVSIPRDVPHKYYVEGDKPALFISFDAPAYDPAQTIYFE
ncbi:cupin domain-containing protein [Pseudomonas monteilii]|uniref:Cupin domain-containing protein n=1 Tax=Pseudomonas monteilii TaxID=76759 RepID=A0A399LXX5_9PSED|nr:cupin domain-containing protein [Pseudomonas monteilii]RII74308.1 cupin domain-containing protein [Pseudomonas monteilii]